MTRAKFDLERFVSSVDTVAALVPADQLFGLLNRSMELPEGWGALVWRQQGDHVQVPAGGRVVDDGTREVLIFRAVPLDLTFQETQLASSDGYLCSAALSISLTLVADRSELLSFRNTVMGSLRRVRLAELEQHLRWPVRQVLVAFAEQRTADDLADGAGLAEFRQAFEEKMAPVFFAAGLGEVRPARVTFESAGLAQTRLDVEQVAIARQRDAARENLRTAVQASREKHLTHLQQVLEQLQGLVDRSPGVALADLIRTFNERDRAQIYDSLWLTLPPRQRTGWLAAAVGEELLFFDPAGREQPVRRVRLAGAAGPLRSLTVARDEKLGTVLLAGAARGVYLVPASADSPAETYLFDDSVSELRGGVNSVALTADHVFGTHSEVGLVRWVRGEPASMERLLTQLTDGARVVRHVQVHGDRLWLSADDKVVSVPADSPHPAEPTVRGVGRAYVSALLAVPAGVYAGTDDGRVLFWPAEAEDRPQTLLSGRDEPVESLHCGLLGGLERLVFTDLSEAIKTRIVGDSFECRYEVAGARVRRCEAAEDFLAGLNESRDRVYLWRPGKPEAPSAVLPVGRLTGRTVQDICLVPVA